MKAQHERMGKFEEAMKEFQAFYGEMKKRTVKLEADAGTGNLQKTSLSYGRVLEVCASCHAKFRD